MEESHERGGPPRRTALCRVRAACRLCGFPVRGFLNGTTCVLQVDGRVLRACCREAGADLAPSCAGLQEAVRAARKPRKRP